MNILKTKKVENDIKGNNNIEYEYKKGVNTIKAPKYGMDKEVFQGQKLFNTCLDLNENYLKKNIKKSWNLMLNGIDTPLDDYGNTALHLATIQNDYELVSLLLLKGANPNVRNQGNVKPRMIAKIMEYPDIYKILLMHENATYMNIVSNYSSKNEENQNANNNVNNNNTVKGKSKKQKGNKLLFSLNFDDKEGFNIPTQISNFQVEGKSKSNRNSFSNKVNQNENFNNENNSIYTNFSNKYERQKNFQHHKKYFPKYYLTAFNMAYLGIYKDNIYSLLDSDKIEEADENGATSLMKASYNGHLNIVENLIEKKANVNAVDNLGYTALVWASLKGHSKVCECLVKNGADVNKVYGHGKAHAVITPLIAAAYNGSKDTVITLINLGANINKKVGPGNTTALVVATLKYRFDVVNELLKRDAEFDEDISWISDGAFFMKILEKSHNHWMVNENFIESIIMNNGNAAISILSDLKVKQSKEMSKKINNYSKKEKKNIKDMQSIYQHYIIKSENPEMKHVISSSIIKKNNSSLLSNESIYIDRNQQIKNKYSYIEETIGNCYFSPMVHELIQLIPLYGTELDTMWFNVLRCAFQLIELVNKNEKSQYTYLYSKIEYYLGIFNKEVSKVVVTYNAENRKVVNNYSLFNNTLLTAKIKDMIIRVNNDLYSLYYGTMLSLGCLPPMNASHDMVDKIIVLAKETFYLTKLANATGYFPKIDTELTFEYKIEENFENENVTDFQTYQQLNNLKNYGKNINSNKNELALSIEDFNTESDDNQLEFSKLIDDHIHHIERASNELFQSFMHSNQSISKIINNIREKIDILIYDIKNNKYLSNYSEKEIFSQEDINIIIIQTKNITEEGIEFLKKCVKIPLKDIFNEQIDEIKNQEEKIDNIFINNNSNENEQIFDDEQIRGDLINILSPCMTKIKLMGFISKKASEKIQKMINETKQKNFGQQRKLFRFIGNNSKKGNGSNLDLSNDKSKELLKEDLTDLIYEQPENSTTLIIKGGKLMKLIECLTWPNDDKFYTVNGFNIDEHFEDDFLMTHHSLESSEFLYNKLISRYQNLQPPKKIDSDEEFQLYRNEKIIPTRIRILNIIDKWIKTYKDEDICLNDKIIEQYYSFADKASKEELKQYKNKLTYTENTNPPKTKNEIIPISKEEPLLPKHISMNELNKLDNLLKNDSNYIFSIPEKEFAKQLTLIESKYYKLVTGTECLDQIWGSKRQKEIDSYNKSKDNNNNNDNKSKDSKSKDNKSKDNKNKDEKNNPSSELIEYPNVTRMIKHTNTLTTWVASCILNSEALKDRENTLRYFTQLAYECYKINNFNGATAIVAGLSMGPVFRLHKTWREFRDKNKLLNENYTLVSETVSPKGQYSNYRKKLKELDDKKEAIMPFLGVYFTDLTFVELGNNDYLDKNSNLNFEKRRKAARIINEIKHYQKKTFTFKPVEPIIDFIENLDNNENQPKYSEDDLYDKSLMFEPREEEDDDDDEEEE